METYTRFVSRRGICRELWSDNGTTFVGLNNELNRLLEDWGNAVPHQQLANIGTTWRFITPGAPHQGGIWEAGVKSVKHHLRRVLGNQSLTANKMYTVLTQIEACLNSRPLVPVSQELSDPQPLTPGHFLIGRPLLQPVLAEDVSQQPANRLTQWGQQQQLVASFWSRWKDDYLLSLQRRMKWYNPTPNIEQDDIVVILDEATPPATWPLGKVLEVIPGKDGFVRNVVIETAASTVKRPIHLKRPIQKVITLVNHAVRQADVQSGSGFPPLN